MWVINLGEQSCWIKLAYVAGGRRSEIGAPCPQLASPDEPSASALDAVWWAVYNDAITAARLNKAAPSQLGRCLLTGLVQRIVSTLFTRVLYFAPLPDRARLSWAFISANTLAGWSTVSHALIPDVSNPSVPSKISLHQIWKPLQIIS